jgi:RHS repeat-associated protein
LTNEKRSGANSYNISYTYDPVGNRTVLTNSGALTTNTYNAGNELVTSQASAGVTTSTYDGDGNLLTSLAPGSQSTTNTWDGENRLTRVALPSGIVDSFTYNGDGLRVQKIDSTGTTNHVWDGLNILLETNASSIIQVVYALEPAVYGNLISQSRSGVNSFFLFDASGSTRELTNSSGTVTDEYVYDSFGNPIGGGTSGTTTNPFRYVGRLGYYTDPELGTYYLRARVYVPSIGRFPNWDPLGMDAGDINLYRYVQNNPVALSDPSGLIRAACNCLCTPVSVMGAGASYSETIVVSTPTIAALPGVCKTECLKLSFFGGRSCGSTGATSPPFSAPPPPGTTIKNSPLGWLGYGLCLCPSKKSLMKLYPLEPSPGGTSEGGPLSPGHQILPLPGPGGSVGAGGAGPSVVVIIVCPKEGVVRFHFGTTSGDAGATIGMYAWFPDCHAAICGGDNSLASNCLMNDIVGALNQAGVKIDGVIDREGCSFGGDGKWHSGTGYPPSENK